MTKVMMTAQSRQQRQTQKIGLDVQQDAAMTAAAPLDQQQHAQTAIAIHGVSGDGSGHFGAG